MTQTTDLGHHGRQLSSRTTRVVRGTAVFLMSTEVAWHLYLTSTQGFEWILVFLAGLYAIGAVLVALDRYRRPVYLAFVVASLVHVAAWVASGTPNFALGVANNGALAVLIALLVVLYRNERGTDPGSIDATDSR